jgi:hypothetical protein
LINACARVSPGTHTHRYMQSESRWPEGLGKAKLAEGS